MKLAILLPLIIFALTYLALAIGKLPYSRLDRTGAAMVGAIAMLLTGTLSRHAALQAIDFRTLCLLLGMMILVADMRQSGVFDFLANRVFSRARTGYRLLALTIGLSGVLAAFFVNDVVCLVLAPIVLHASASSGIHAVPLLLGLASASNVGSAATITGNPQDMIVAGFAHLNYVSYLVHVAPSAIIGLVLDFAVIAWVYRADLRHTVKSPQASAPPLQSKPVAAKAIIIALGALIGFALGFPTDLVALSAASIVLLVGHSRLERIYDQVDFTMLLLFAGLFVVVGGAQTTGFQKRLLQMVGAHRLTHPVILAASITVLSNLVSNVPAVMLFRPLMPLLGGSPQLVGRLLAAASTYAGNLTLLGSVANLIVVQAARAQGQEIGFAEHLRVGIPITLLTLTVAVLTIG